MPGFTLTPHGFTSKARQSRGDESIGGSARTYFNLVFSPTEPPGPFLLPHNSMGAESACSTPGERL